MPNEHYVTIGDILKSEADFNNRIAIPAAAGTKTGALVKYNERNEYLFALTDETNGEVLVQPHNCTIFLGSIPQANIDAITTDEDGLVTLTVENLVKQGDLYGIKYVGTPMASGLVMDGFSGGDGGAE
ncbi:hypothetical protein ACTXGO_00855 [Psychrobacter sp. T6-1]|uniref:hypothetical protein n=1 Tax=Psychrobacter sp. T6-1 TaxID=3457447 RepID=UPI003FD2C127